MYRPGSNAIGDLALTVGFLIFGLGVEAMVVTMAVGAFRGWYPGY
ncbi:hypothetical protein ACIA8O_04315 [Kitasatospora sp. NPDC051853]